MAKRIARIALEVLSLLVLLGTIIFLIINWKNIPAQVPNRWNGKGEITEWQEKMILLFFPAIMAIIYVTMFFVKTVQFRSPGKTVRVYAPELMFPILKLPLLSGLAYITVCSALIHPLGVWFFPAFFALVFIPLIVFSVIVLPKISNQA
ncbi:MAG: DUF1648 domain-containing protein [Oscillospiraceae bacterium]|nr:DUF1648 domain-containing protein [Oscillospiraceae bacterium]